MKKLSEREQAMQTIGQIIETIRVGMLTTVAGDGSMSLRSRPMIAAEPRFNGQLLFFTEALSGHVHDLGQDNRVNVSFSHPTEACYVSISGEAEVIRDEPRAEFLWDPQFSRWFSPDAKPSNLHFIRVTVDAAEYWDASTSSVVQVLTFAKGLLGDGSAPAARHAKVEWPATSGDVTSQEANVTEDSLAGK